MSKHLARICDEIGLKALFDSHRDTKVLCIQRLVRFFGYGSSTLVLTLFLTALGHSTEKTGLFMTLTLLGDVVISLVLTVYADKIGRRRILAFGAILMSASGIIFTVFSHYWILVLASVLGVISPSGNEIGPFRAIEESVISQLVSRNDRSSVIAWYTLFGTAGAAAGSVVIGWVVYTLQHTYSWSPLNAYRTVFAIYAFLGLIKFALCLVLSSTSEVASAKAENNPQSEEHRPLLQGNDAGQEIPQPTKPRQWKFLLTDLSAHTVGLIARLCVLFAMDSFGSGIASNSWMVYFFNSKFGLQEGRLGNLFFFTNILASASNLAAASLARRIGLVKTMIFTHLPASVTLALIPVPTNSHIAEALLLIRSSINSMDQAPRQAFLAAAVLPEERTTVMGIVNVCKTLSQAGGPSVTGALAGVGKLGIAFVLAGALKCAYDLFMLGMFVGYRTREEMAEEEAEQVVRGESLAPQDEDAEIPRS